MVLKNILSLKKYCFLKPVNDSNVLLTPLSQQIKQNIAFQWIQCIRRLPAIEVFVTPVAVHSDPVTKSQMNSLKSILENYNQYYREWSEGSGQPIGVIQRFTCLRDSKALFRFLPQKSHTNRNDSMVFALFCQKHDSLYWFQKIQGIHNHWFRNLSKSPLNSKFSSEINENIKKWILSYKSDEFSDELESIDYFCDSLPAKKFSIDDSDVISCALDLDNSLIALLCDAFTQRIDSNGRTVKTMQLNASIAPFKIAFTYRQNVLINETLIELTNHLILALKQFDIPVLPFTANSRLSIDSCDELGIPFTAILDTESTHNGVIALRNRDSTLEESIHVSNFQKTICLYLNVIHPSSIRNKY